ncbi:MAG: hypothetical protein OCD76_01510 [Reichenbachiella sp.]
MIKNSKDPEILNILSGIGIDKPYLDGGLKLYQDALKYTAEQSKEQQEKSRSYDDYQAAKGRVEHDHANTFELIKILSNADTDLQNRLNLKFIKPNPVEEWINGGYDQYMRVLNETDFLTKLSRFKLTVEVLETRKEDVLQLRELRNTSQLESGEAQVATQNKQEKLKELQDFTRELKDLSIYALGSQSQLLEKLGIRVPSN